MQLLKPLLLTLAVLAVWVVLADRNPTLTYHFAPMIAVAAGPWLARSTRGHLDTTAAAAVVLPGLLATLTVAAGLHATDRLLGPTFWSSDGAIGEAPLLAIVTAVGAIVVLSRPAGVEAAS